MKKYVLFICTILLLAVKLPVQAQDETEDLTARLALTLKDSQITAGKTTTVTPKISSNYDDMKVSYTYKSSKPDTAAVNSSGKITGKWKGSAVITVKAAVTAGQQKTEVSKTVTVKVVNPSLNVTLNKSSVSLVIGKTHTVKPKVNTPLKIKKTAYAVSNSKIASVNKNGKITAKKKGTAKVTVKVTATDGQVKTKTVTVKVPNPSVSLNHTSKTIVKGNSVQLVPTLKNSSSKITGKTYKSSNTKVATVTKSGTVKGKKAGTATVTIKVKTKDKHSFTKKVKITVKNSATSKTAFISLSGVSVLEGKSHRLAPKLKNSSSKISSSAFSSSNSKVASVSKTGNVTGKKKGTATITVTSKTKDKQTLVKKVKVTVKTPTLAQRVAETKTAKKSSQIITVAGGKLTLWEKSGSTWKSVLSTSCNVGRNGISSSKKEGDGKTPAGAYSLPLAFGLGDNPGTKMEYRKITKNSYWISNPADKEYNTWQERTSSSSKDEHLIKYSVYKYAMVIHYNSARTSGKGSAIFLHCSNGKSTAGCVSVPESKMLSLMKKVNKGAYIIIAPSEAKISNY